jgi:hypothetical protein
VFWFWLNMPLAAVFFAAVTGIPLWLVIKRPDTAPSGQVAPTSDVTQQPQPTLVALASSARAAQESARHVADAGRVGAAA